MSVILDEAAIARFFHDGTGPVGRMIERRATAIKSFAANNAPFRDGGLIVGLKVEGPLQDPESLYMLVGSDATKPWRGHPDFNYPIAQELGGLTPSGFPYRNPFLVPAVLTAGFRPES